MKKGLLILMGTISLLACDKERFSQYFTVSEKSTMPYDIKVFHDQLMEVNGEDNFTPFNFSTNSLNEVDYGIYVSVTKRFNPSTEEIAHLKDWVSTGNSAFIASFDISREFLDSLLFFSPMDESGYFRPLLVRDQLSFNFRKDSTSYNFTYPGHHKPLYLLDSAFLFDDRRVAKFDTLAVYDSGEPLILKLEVGLGFIYLCDNPLIFSNYFILHKENYTFLNYLFEELNISTEVVYWDEYYGKRLNGSKKSSSKIWELIQNYEALKWAVFTLLLGTLLYFIIYWRREVQPIELNLKKANRPLAFVETLAGVYWRRKDHSSIARKLFQQFFEYLYLKHNITSEDYKPSEFEKLATKMNKKPKFLHEIWQQLENYNQSSKISESQLEGYYASLRKFYNS